MQRSLIPPSIVVGVDGSKAAVRAALWAVDEAVSRDIPLRLLYAVDQGDRKVDPDTAARRLATAEIAIRHAFTVVEATEKPVKIEVEIAQEPPVTALVGASQSAAMICVGAVGINHFQPDRVGSTAATLAASAHCAVAIVRANDGQTGAHAGWIVAELDQSPDNGVVLETAMEEARLRRASLRVFTCWQSHLSHTSDGHSVCEGNRRVRAELDRRLARWIRRYPGIDVQSEAVHGTMLNHLAKIAPDAQLIVVGAREPQLTSQLVGPAGNTVLNHTDSSLLIVNRQHL
jgi:nucleotide-binding universal stress UspA family protein